MPELVECLNCGTTLDVPKCLAKRKKFCGKGCRMSHNRVAVVCEVCGKEETVIPSRAKKYHTCSRTCMGKRQRDRLDQKVEVVCVVCNNGFRVKTNLVGKRSTCSYVCRAELLRTRYAGEGNPNYKGKGSYPVRRDAARNKENVHRLVMREVLGLDRVPKGFGIHHRDSNVRNNVPENLALLTTADHKWIHHQVGLAVMRAIFEGTLEIPVVAGWCDDPERARRILTTNFTNQVGVVKSRELLEHPAEGNQQPSQSGTAGRFNDQATKSRTDGKGPRVRDSLAADDMV